MWPQGSQDAYYQNYYGQIYNRSNYNPNPQNPYYPNGGYGYGNPNPNASSPQIYQNNNRNPQIMQPIKLDVAMNKSSYSSSNRDIIFETILDNFSEKKENKVYLQSLSNNKIFIIVKRIFFCLSSNSSFLIAFKLAFSIFFLFIQCLFTFINISFFCMHKL